jgi:hypothetical protein
MSGLPPSHFQDFLSEFSHLKVGILEKPFSLETLRRKLANIQGIRKLSGHLPSGAVPKARIVSQSVPLAEAGASKPIPRPAIRRDV